MKKTVLVTGNKGFIGSYLQTMLDHHYTTVGFSRAEGYDMTDYDSLENMQSAIDIIVHTAAVASNDYEECFQNNVVGTLNLCKFAKARGVKTFILLSTIFAIDEEDNGYFNSYGKTKKMSEEAASAYCSEHGIDLVILRLAQVYDDARLAQNGQAMLYYFIDTIQKHGEITLFGKTNPLRNYIHIDYLCGVVKEILAEERVGSWNITEEKSHTITEIAYMLFDIVNKEPNLNILPEKADIPSVYIPQKDRYMSENLTSISLKEGMKRILNYDK